MARPGGNVVCDHPAASARYPHPMIATPDGGAPAVLVAIAAAFTGWLSDPEDRHFQPVVPAAGQR